MDSPVLVIGATGKTGRRLVPLLAERGVAVRAARRRTAPAVPGVTPVYFDWADERTHATALAGARAVYVVGMHYAASLNESIAQVTALLDRTRAAGVERIVLLSSYGVDQAPPEDPMRGLELAAAATGVPTTILRPSAFMENFAEPHWLGLRASIRDRDTIAVPGGDQPVSYVAVADIATVAALALTEDGHAGKENTEHTLTGPAALTVPEIAEHISRAVGRRIRHMPAGPDTVRAALAADGAPPDYVDYVASAYLMATTAGLLAPVTTDVATLTGRPATTFDAFAAGAARAWLRA